MGTRRELNDGPLEIGTCEGDQCTLEWIGARQRTGEQGRDSGMGARRRLM